MTCSPKRAREYFLFASHYKGHEGMNGFSTQQAYEIWLLCGLDPEQAEWAAAQSGGGNASEGNDSKDYGVVQETMSDKDDDGAALSVCK